MPTESLKQVFALMPFGPEFDDVYMAIKDASADRSLRVAVECLRADEIKAPGKITDDVIAAIQDADLIIADITGSNP